MQNEPLQKAIQRSTFHSRAFLRRLQWKRSTLTFCEGELLITRSRKRLQAKSIAKEIQRCSKVAIFCPPYWLPTLRKPLSTKKTTFKTRLHSSRMRTARYWPYLQHALGQGGTWSWGVYSMVSEGVYLVLGCLYMVPGGVPGPGGVVYLVPGGCTWSQGVYLVWGVYLSPRGVYLVWGVCSGGGVSAPGPRGVSTPVPGGCQVLPPVNRMTDACKNITLPSFVAGGKKQSALGIQNGLPYTTKLLVFPEPNVFISH